MQDAFGIKYSGFGWRNHGFSALPENSSTRWNHAPHIFGVSAYPDRCFNLLAFWDRSAAEITFCLVLGQSKNSAGMQRRHGNGEDPRA